MELVNTGTDNRQIHSMHNVARRQIGGSLVEHVERWSPCASACYSLVKLWFDPPQQNFFLQITLQGGVLNDQRKV